MYRWKHKCDRREINIIGIILRTDSRCIVSSCAFHKEKDAMKCAERKRGTCDANMGTLPPLKNVYDSLRLRQMAVLVPGLKKILHPETKNPKDLNPENLYTKTLELWNPGPLEPKNHTTQNLKP